MQLEFRVNILVGNLLWWYQLALVDLFSFERFFLRGPARLQYIDVRLKQPDAGDVANDADEVNAAGKEVDHGIPGHKSHIFFVVLR